MVYNYRTINVMPMNSQEILKALQDGKNVYWQAESYPVISDQAGINFYIKSLATGHCIKLLQSDGQTLNGTEDDFFVKERI
jgi:hypothetical protein